MTDDIVTRLREAEDPLLFGDIERSDGATLIREAADEIERLRKELNLARRAYDMEIFGESDIDENGVVRGE